MKDCLIFTLNDQFFAIDLSFVKFVIQAVAVTPAPLTSENLLGLIKIGKNLVPVLDLRHYLELKKREIQLSDQFVICEQEGKNLALWIDSVIEICRGNSTFSDVPADLQKADIFHSVLYHNDRMVLLFNPLKISLQLSQ